MKLLVKYILISITLILIESCKSNFNTPLNLVTSAHIKREIFESVRKKYVDSLIININVYSDRDFIRNSKYLLQIYTWNKESYYYQAKDTIHSYEGIEAHFEVMDSKYKNLFNKQFKYIVQNDSQNKNDIAISYNDPLSEISIYFNKKNEITYIDPGFDTIYYRLLKNKIKFSNSFIENLEN